MSASETPRPGEPSPIDAILDAKRVVVVFGTGGVGKTTVAAALAIRGAARGRRTLVCTIDPAKRLADSLGVGPLGNDEVPIPEDRLRAAGIETSAPLHATQLDTKHTFDRLIDRHAPNAEIRDRILANPFYREISGQVIGSQEFVALEKLYELHDEGRYDLVILDTPPNKHALDFLDASERMTSVLDTGILKWLLLPYFKKGSRLSVMQKGVRAAARWIGDLVGLAFLKNLSEFFQAFEGLYEGFRDRARRAGELLRERTTTSFVLVTSPAWSQRDPGRSFVEELRRAGLPLEAVVVNRVRPAFQTTADGRTIEDLLDGAPEPEAALRDADLDPRDRAVAARLVSAWRRQRELAAADRRVVDALRRLAGDETAFRCIPFFDGDVHDLEALSAVCGHLGAREAAA